MSCHLVCADFTDAYFRTDLSNYSSEGEADTCTDSSVESDTDPESVSTDGAIQVPPYHVLAAADGYASMDQLTAAATLSFNQHAPARLRLARQPTIINRIVHFAMQADDNQIVLPSATGVLTNPTVAVSLLCINHRLYHQCRDIMYRHNTFVASKFGAGLHHLTKQLGFHYCGEVCSSTTAISSVRFELGCVFHDGMGLIKMEAFTQAIKDLTRPLTVKHLRIDFLPFCFVGNRDLAVFADALKGKIRVERVFEMTGLDVHWACDLRVVPKALGMKLNPLICDYIPHDDKQGVQGFFGCSYEPATSNNELAGLDTDGNDLIIKDGRFYYERHELGLYKDSSD
ncbi:MAG: hypothetical protein Q9166_001471 [cf. Caloplaca sp. 2 TL-2023]